MTVEELAESEAQRRIYRICSQLAYHFDNKKYVMEYLREVEEIIQYRVDNLNPNAFTEEVAQMASTLSKGLITDLEFELKGFDTREY